MWHRMDSADPGLEVIDALADLARAELPLRAALLPRSSALATSTDARTRAVAVALLGGATGVVAWRAMVGALDDAEGIVREAAVEAMAKSCVTQPMRWAHALFHRRDDVRLFAVQRTPEQSRVLLAWARADPVTASYCEGTPWPTEPLALIEDLWRRGMLSASEAAAGLRQCTAVALREHAILADRRDSVACRSFIAAAKASAAMPELRGHDCLDAWLDIAINTSDGAWLIGVLRDVVTGQEDLRARFLVALCAVARARGWDPVLARAAVHADPTWLGFAWVPLDVRRAVLDATWPDAGDLTLATADVTAFIRTLAFTDEGTPSLARAAAIAAWLREPRLATVIEALGEDAALSSAPDDPVGWAAIVRLPHEAAHVWWLDHIRETRPDRAGVCAALLCLRLVSRDDTSVFSPTGVCLRDREALVRGLLEVSRDPRVCPDLGSLLAAFDAVEVAGLVPLQWWIADISQQPRTVGLAATILGRALSRDAVEVARCAAALGPDPAIALVRWCEDTTTLTPDALVVFADALAEYTGNPEVDELVRRAGRRAAPPPEPRAPVVGLRRLTQAEADRIATCAPEDLDDAVAIALVTPCHGLVDALARRPHATRSLTVAAAIVACTDGIESAAVALARHAPDDPTFRDDLRHATLTLWRDSDAVPPLVDAILVAFERNAEGLATWFELQEGGYSGALRIATGLPSPAREILWSAIAEVLSTWAVRRMWSRLEQGRDPSLVSDCRALLGTELGAPAAKVLVALHRAGVAELTLLAARSEVVSRASSYDRATHDALSGWISLHGVASPRDRPARRLPAALPADERIEIAAISDLERLARLCVQGARATVATAVERLVELPRGSEVLARLLAGELAHIDLVLETLPRWTTQAQATASTIVGRADIAVERRYRIAMALARCGGTREVRVVLRLAADPSATRVAGVDDWTEMLARADDVHAIAALAVQAADPMLADAALTWLLALPKPNAEALRLAISGTGGASEGFRRSAAVKLLEQGDDSGTALVLLWLTDDATPETEAVAAYARWFASSDVVAAALVDLAVMGGPSVASEARVFELLLHATIDVRPPLLARLLVEGSDAKTRKRIAEERWLDHSHATKLSELAQTFAWGVMRGRELTGKVFSIHMTPKREQWGYTHLGTTAIHVTPVPILARAPRGRDVVEGLLLHEIGHHIWHGGKIGQRVWRRAQKENLHPLFNLVADEHLERNLRSIDADFGDRIKRLDAYAFQHAPREIAVSQLLAMMLADASAVLADIGPTVAHDPDCLRIDGGRVLGRLDALGHSFARFVRALRMGLGNRSGDPKVDLALTYFGAGFRSLDMNGLLRVTRALAEIFGAEAKLAMGFGGHEAVEWNERDADIVGDGIRDDEVQREVQRILEPPRGATARPQGGGGLMINVGGDAYAKLTKVQPVTRDPAAHQAVTSTVARHATRLRETLEHLGLGYVPTGARLRGHAIDRSRLEHGIIRGDPRLLRAREIELTSDLFLGVVVDCSGSMSGPNIARAMRFAVLVAEAARGLAGVDARFFGFTDQIIWDAGTAERCAASSLVAGGGNNDAGALDYVANIAARSRRRSRLIVMISDGLPTECSVGALRGVVRSLTRRHHTCCAQVAVRPISEICFPHYVLLDEENLDAAVRRFAGLIARLVGQALAM